MKVSFFMDLWELYLDLEHVYITGGNKWRLLLLQLYLLGWDVAGQTHTTPPSLLSQHETLFTPKAASPTPAGLQLLEATSYTGPNLFLLAVQRSLPAVLFLP